ncbi:hypothetical protein GGR56DRAFT_443948 [Xylariaceae sp. FL0804]|nr:hypothetical protein GGR56DRAFT_443948 [Xylariaceae sp. FL0804]
MRARPDCQPHQKIANLCQELSRPDGSCCGYLAEEKCRYYVYTVTTSTTASVTPITLDRIIRGDIMPAPTRRKRYALSLVLASSFLQLIETPWLQTSFNKQDVMFYGSAGDPNVFVLDEPHFNADLIKLMKGKGVEVGTTVAESLDRLGILLLELCFGRPLEEQRQRRSWPAGATYKERAAFDLLAARQWQCEVGEQAGPEYAEAVGWCLGGNRSASLEHWRREMLKRVVVPLQRTLDYLVAGDQGTTI